MNSLPPSWEAEAEFGSFVEEAPEDRRLPWTYLGRGRGALLGLALCGLAAFWAPWVELERPEWVTLSGYDLARGNAGWLWGGAIGWFLLIPLLLSRRTVYQLRGIRVIACTFALMTGGEALLLYLKPPASHVYYGPGLSWSWGLFVSAALSFLAAFVSVRLGGTLTDFRDLPGAARVGDRQIGEAIH